MAVLDQVKCRSILLIIKHESVGIVHVENRHYSAFICGYRLFQVVARMAVIVFVA